MNYDEKYDMDVLGDWWFNGGVAGNVMIAKRMREPGVEPGCPKAPVPKSRLDPANAPSRPQTEGEAVTERQPAPAIENESTTKSTTDFAVLVDGL